jgi:putative acetyltransferase
MEPAIRESTSEDHEALLDVARDAFGSEAEARLVADLLADPTARPVSSLVAEDSSGIVGHILFSRVRLEPERSGAFSLLAPMAVRPAWQGRGIGGELVKAGLLALERQGCELVFVLGHAWFYPRFGFEPARPFGYLPPFDAVTDPDNVAWRVHALTADALAKAGGRVVCADCLMQPAYWVPPV